jgi:hypothetical protein
MSDSPEQTQASPELRHVAAEAPLQAYGDADDTATSYFETPQPPALWLVQVSLFERPSMSREQLLDELQNGLVRASTLVWRTGMRDWCAVAQVEELRRALPLDLLPGESRPLSQPNAHRAASVAWLCGAAAALVTLSVTLYALSAAGVLEMGVRASRARPSHLAASLRVPEHSLPEHSLPEHSLPEPSVPEHSAP